MQKDYDIEDLIVKLFTGSISPEENAQLKNWLNESEENKAYFLQLENVWHVSSPAFNPDEIDTDKAEEKLSRIINSEQKKKPFMLYLQRVAAILFIPVFLLTAYVVFNQGKTISKAESAYQEVFAPYGVSSKISLSDGSVVWLNSGSSLKYPLLFKKNERKVFLEGEAFFEVKSDPSNQFVVHAHDLSIVAKGTEFNVEAYSADSLIVVTLVNGKVEVEMDSERIVSMKPNQQLKYCNVTDKYNIIQTDTYKWYAWKDGTLIFRDDRLDYVFKKIGQMYNVDIKVMDKDIAGHQYRATFEDETLDEILELMKKTAPIDYRKVKREKAASGRFSNAQIEIYKTE